MKEGGLYDGRGLILGPDRPFKNIYILGMIFSNNFRTKYDIHKWMEIYETDGNDGHRPKKLMKYRKY